MSKVICSGPIIIENNKVLLIKEQKQGKITPWFFPGGKVEKNDASLEDTCRRETKEEVGIDIEIIKQLETLEDVGVDGSKVTLFHYLAKRIGEIKPDKNIIEWGWFDINNLPDNCADNVYEIIEEYTNNNTNKN